MLRLLYFFLDPVSSINEGAKGLYPLYLLLSVFVICLNFPFKKNILLFSFLELDGVALSQKKE